MKIELGDRISVVIPCYEMRGKGAAFLYRALVSTLEQQYQNVEIVVTDHSENNDVKDVCDGVRPFAEKSGSILLYVRNEEDRGSSSANINRGISLCSGKIIKILMQDDFFYLRSALTRTCSAFSEANEYCAWLVTGNAFGPNGSTIGTRNPSWTHDLLNGNNRIGAPSVLSIKNEKPELFRNDLIWMMDCEYYYRMFRRFGLPIFLMEPHVFVATHPDQLTELISHERKKSEEAFIKTLHSSQSGIAPV
jgi:glycosyltransferase involved in cell wall biosynthesis